jgi:methylase of polypeptide subunit release factors
MNIDHASLVIIREYLDEMMYALVDLRLSFEVPPGPTGFPKFQSLQQILKRLNPKHQVIFRLFRLGESVDHASVTSAVPQKVLNALTTLGLLSKTGTEWRTPDMLIVPAEGLYLLVGVPSSYPTASHPCRIWFDLSSHVVAKALPVSLSGLRVLDICSGSGIQLLLCAARGAAHGIGLELSEEAVKTARANSILNGLDHKVEFRQSNLLDSLKDGEQFDFVVCNTPYAPVVYAAQAPVALESIGNSVLLELLDKLPAYLSAGSRGILATWRAIGRQSSTYQMEFISQRLEERGFSTFAFVDRAPDTMEGVLRILQTDLEQRPDMDAGQVEETLGRVKDLLQGSGGKMDGFYNQLIYLRKGKIESAGAERAICGLAAPVLVGAAQ